MNLARVRTLIDKEWAEVFKNRLVVMTVVALPLLFTLMPLGILFATRGALATGGNESADLPPAFLKTCGELPAGECFQVYLVNQFMILFMMMPLIIPISIAAYSIVGEKTTRSLEPLLATPLTTEELLAGKGLAAVLPAVGATWGAFLLFLALAPLTGIGPGVYAHLLSPLWLAAVFLVGPLMAVLAVNFAVIVSSRVNDPRVAEQISAVLIVPLMGLVFGQLAGVILLSLPLMLGTAAVLAALDVGAVYLGAELFQRENILTKWK